MAKIEIMCFSHTKDQFETATKLMDFLNTDLKHGQMGYYRYRVVSSPGNLAPGFIVLFYKDNFILGSSIVDKGARALTDSEIEECSKIYSENDCGRMKNILKFIRESI